MLAPKQKPKPGCMLRQLLTLDLGIRTNVAVEADSNADSGIDRSPDAAYYYVIVLGAAARRGNTNIMRRLLASGWRAD